jgi:hypothetical protein
MKENIINFNEVQKTMKRVYKKGFKGFKCYKTPFFQGFIILELERKEIAQIFRYSRKGKLREETYKIDNKGFLY